MSKNCVKMWMEEGTRDVLQEESDGDGDCDSNGAELPIWVRGVQRWVSGVIPQTTCSDIISVLLSDEEARGKCVNQPECYQITERWRGVEQPLDPDAVILDIWNAWGTAAQPEVKISLRRIKDDRFQHRKKRCRSDSSTRSDKSAYKTVHPRRLHALENEKQSSSSTEQLLKLVLAQGEVIRRQLRKLRHSEHQIGFLEDKTHKARIRKHGSNYLLETYLKGLSEATDPCYQEQPNGDRHSDSGVVTEGDSEQSNHNKQSSSPENERFSPSSDELQKDIKDDDESSTTSETTIKEQLELFETISKMNKKLLKEEEHLVRLHANIKKCEKETKANTEDLSKTLSSLRNEMAKSACEMQHNEVVLEETMEKIVNRRTRLESLHKDLVNEDQESEMLHALLYSAKHKVNKRLDYCSTTPSYTPKCTKEVLDTLV